MDSPVPPKTCRKPTKKYRTPQKTTELPQFSWFFHPLTPLPGLYPCRAGGARGASCECYSSTVGELKREGMDERSGHCWDGKPAIFSGCLMVGSGFSLFFFYSLYLFRRFFLHFVSWSFLSWVFLRWFHPCFYGFPWSWGDSSHNFRYFAGSPYRHYTYTVTFSGDYVWFESILSKCKNIENQTMEK